MSIHCTASESSADNTTASSGVWYGCACVGGGYTYGIDSYVCVSKFHFHRASLTKNIKYKHLGAFVGSSGTHGSEAAVLYLFG